MLPLLPALSHLRDVDTTDRADGDVLVWDADAQGYQHRAGEFAYTHSQPTPLSVWTINHGLGRFPALLIVDSAGHQVDAASQYVDASTIVVTFSGPFAGTAYLS